MVGEESESVDSAFAKIKSARLGRGVGHVYHVYALREDAIAAAGLVAGRLELWGSVNKPLSAAGRISALQPPPHLAVLSALKSLYIVIVRSDLAFASQGVSYFVLFSHISHYALYGHRKVTHSLLPERYQHKQ